MTQTSQIRRMRRTKGLPAIVLLTALALGTTDGHAQDAATEPDAAAPPVAGDVTQTSFQAVSSGWTTLCTAPVRGGDMACELEVRVGLQGDGRQLVRMTLQQGPDLDVRPSVLLQLPHGLFNAAGVRVAVDGAAAGELPVQTCDEAGCYAGTTLGAELEATLREGSQLTVTFQDLARNDIGVPIVLEGFATGLDSIR